jgi:hypothetical protein
MSGGWALVPPSIQALTLFSAALGYSLDDLGEEFISNNIQIMCVTRLPEVEQLRNSILSF